ncbi:MAG TPA: hypothetical protein VE398_03215 [Acidobacteriota bacterium]|nr:hypothetical protein [Acidobacteriota bacterium]
MLSQKNKEAVPGSVTGAIRIIAAAIFWLGASLASQRNAEPIPVNYDVLSGYTVVSRFERDASASFLVIEDQTQFDRTFEAAAVMNDGSNRLPPRAFESRIVVAAIKRDSYIWSYQVEEVSCSQDILYVHYRPALEDGGSAKFASALIISVERQKYSGVVFVENGKIVKRLKIKM